MLTIPKMIYDALVEHARRDFPLEACGILGGSDGVVTEHYAMTNTDKSNEHFMMDPKEQFAVVKDLRGKGKGMVAIYHSHPETPARPSEEDIRLALTPDVSYVIVSLAGPEPVVRSFKITEGISTEEEVLIQ
ncbi:M67 family metallopeptidase [Geobacter sp. DSM 9736]|uniref:M67 family metallopeptidase n=1 Tax=Geobacter sp. DSM 9736 TaxID=1277350 RepID=UPI000B501762|nr:M67 family metallopeptidase [Geobacter sp. DSM 9736]SNB45117.1 Proteasome lid subunit RPN8/RPN11, contains Jab1/MPN metalloenzyme (JAMM) motif [Geobacter sp. DSM 9736]